MPSSCKDIRAALAQCLQESDCIMVQRNQPTDCLKSPLLEELPMRCQQLRKGLSDCKRGMVDMRKRFRGNHPVSLSAELEGASGSGSGESNVKTSGGGTTDGGQLYAGKPAFGAVKEISGNEVQMDPTKTRGL